MSFEKLAEEYKNLGLDINQSIVNVRKELNSSNMDKNFKDLLNTELNNINDILANPDKGFNGLLISINKLNDTSIKP